MIAAKGMIRQTGSHISIRVHPRRAGVYNKPVGLQHIRCNIRIGISCFFTVARHNRIFHPQLLQSSLHSQ